MKSDMEARMKADPDILRAPGTTRSVVMNLIDPATGQEEIPVRKVVLVSVFREHLIGGISVHTSNLYARLRELEAPVEKVDFSGLITAPGIFRKLLLILGVGFQLVGHRLSGAKIFHFHGSNRAIMYFIWGPLLWLLGGKLMLSMHSGYGYDKFMGKRWEYRALSWVGFRFLHRLIFMNPEESERIRRRFPFLRDRVVTVNPFIAPKIAYVNSIRERRPAPDDVFRVAVIGNWAARYNVEEAFRGALAFRRKTGVQVQVTILQSSNMRDTTYQARLEDEFNLTREEMNVEVFEDRTDVLEILAAHDVLIRPSLLDSYGLSVAESLLVGTPAIATNVCRRCDQALLYEQGDIERLVGHLEAVYNSRGGETKNLLNASEDSFTGYLTEYVKIK